MPAPRPQWKGFLKLSLVTCPIALYPAITDEHRVKFRQVNRRTGNRLRHQLVDTVTGETVEASDKGRGYEIGPHQYLPVEEQEIEAARAAAVAPPASERSSRRFVQDEAPEQPERENRPSGRPMQADEDDEDVVAVEPLPPVRRENNRTIEIQRFVPREQIDPSYYHKPYFLAPRELVGQEAYAVIRDAMREKGMVALGHVTLSNRERPIAIETFGRGMRGFILRHLHEVRSEAEYFSDIPEMKLPRDMLQVAKHILEMKTADFDPSFLEDRYQQALVQMLRKKQTDTTVRPRRVSASRENVINLMDALKRSIANEDRRVIKRSSRRPPAKSKQTASRSRKSK